MALYWLFTGSSLVLQWLTGLHWTSGLLDFLITGLLDPSCLPPDLRISRVRLFEFLNIWFFRFASSVLQSMFLHSLALQNGISHSIGKDFNMIVHVSWRTGDFYPIFLPLLSRINPIALGPTLVQEKPSALTVTFQQLMLQLLHLCVTQVIALMQAKIWRILVWNLVPKSLLNKVTLDSFNQKPLISQNLFYIRKLFVWSYNTHNFFVILKYLLLCWI